jgi:hypothetical protein
LRAAIGAVLKDLVILTQARRQPSSFLTTARPTLGLHTFAAYMSIGLVIPV